MYLMMMMMVGVVVVMLLESIESSYLDKHCDYCYDYDELYYYYYYCYFLVAVYWHVIYSIILED